MGKKRLHAESWRSSSFGPRNIGTGHKYTPSKNNVKTDESILSQDANRVTTPERAYARQQYEGNLDSLLDSWYEHPEDPTLLRHMYDTGMLKYDNRNLYSDPYIDVWAKKKNIQSEKINDKLTQSYYQLNPVLTTPLAWDTVPSSLLDRNDLYEQRYDSASIWMPDQYKREYSVNNTGHHIPIEGKEAYASEPLIKDAPAQSSTIYRWKPFSTDVRRSSPYDGAYNRKIESIPQEGNRMTRIWWDDPTIRYTSDPIWKDRFDLPEIPKKPFNWGALVAGGATAAGLTGLGLLAAADSNNNQSETQIPSQAEPEIQPESMLEQEYVTQNIPSFSSRINDLFDLYQQQEQLVKDKAAYEAYLRAQEMGQRIASKTGYAPEFKEGSFVFPQELPKEGSNIKTAGLDSPDGGEVPQELNKLSGVKPKVIKDTSKGPVVLNDPNHRKTRDVQNNSVTSEQVAANQMVNQYAGIPVEVVRAKNQPFLTTDVIWNRLRQKGLVSPEEGIRSGLFTPDEVRYITENDLWRYR